MMPKKYVLLITLTLALTTLACTIHLGGPEIPEPPIPVSTEAAQSLQEEVQRALTEGAQTGFVIITFTEEQITSYLTFKLQNRPQPMFQDPQVYLRDGEMRIYGTARRGYFVANIGIVLTVGVNEQGKPDIRITSVDFGPFPVPDGLKEALTAIIEEAYTGALGPVATGFRLESITIRDGLMVVAGRIK
ncbi:MAG: hypothetical protein D6770_10445 [Anaerolineae bacterium]|nr:MAG: hypothetical protein D6770_10445 [Anaerolineae bacterium]